jgi:site-specific DNA-methyltransferase (adenine-specific)/site-specific DNA-methyltransferase (cytosine-N4-specific)
MPESVADRFSRGHEHVFMLTRSKRYYFNSDAAREVSADGRGSRRIKDVWNIPTTPYNGHHIAAFPPALAERCIATASREGDTVLDMFMGSGTVAQAAHRLGRRWVGIDINPSSRKQVADRLREVHK